MSFVNLFRKEPAHTTNMASRQLCVVIDFSVMPAKPKPARVDEFIEKDVQLDWSKVRGLQLNNITSHVYIKLDSKESAEELAEQHNLAHTMDYKGVTYHIPFFVADGGTDVKLHDLPFDMPNHLIAEKMTQFGEVMSVKDDCWRNLFRKVPNGVRIVRIRISTPIPSYLSVSGTMTLVTHKNQIPTCRHCNRRVHYTMKCSDYAKSLREINKPPPEDPATAVSQPEGIKPSSEDSATAGGQSVAPISSMDIAPDAQQSSTRDETPPPLLTPANILSPTTTAAAVEIEEPQTSRQSTVGATVGSSEDGGNDDETRNHPWYQLAVQVTGELKRRTEELERQEEKEHRRQAKKEDAKIKSPPVKKKKNFSLYTK